MVCAKGNPPTRYGIECSHNAHVKITSSQISLLVLGFCHDPGYKHTAKARTLEIMVISALSELMICAPVFIFYIQQLSSFRAPTLWFIDLTVATCHIQYAFLSLSAIFFTRKRTKHENTRSPPFSYRRLLGAQSINTERTKQQQQQQQQ